MSKVEGYNKDLKELLYDVQKNRIFKDDKSFVDLAPRYNTSRIREEYLLVRDNPKFNLQDFISRHFIDVSPEQMTHLLSPNIGPREYIKSLWHKLERSAHQRGGSLIALPNAYIVPGGRFNEQFYWDSYFIMLGLAADGEWDLLEGIVKNATFMIKKYGFVPTANRTYLLSRSQPPFFSRMVVLLAEHKGEAIFAEYLPYLLAEYKFWMTGSDMLSTPSDNKVFFRTVKMHDGTILNRYYDSMMEPRPESLGKDLQIAREANWRTSALLYLNIRAAAESGWDFSSRWFSDPKDIRTIRTTSIIPIDLNCLLYQLEELISRIYILIDKPQSANKFTNLSVQRAKALQKYCWDEPKGFFFDYDFSKNSNTSRLTIASVFPLYAKIATSRQASLVASKLESDFLKTGGLATTLIDTEQQWDGSNGWAPLQWIAIEGLRNYGYDKLADKIKKRWVDTNINILNKKSRLIEKYNVESPDLPGGGGEYPLQVGFGWTNGVLAALLQEGEPAASKVYGEPKI